MAQEYCEENCNSTVQQTAADNYEQFDGGRAMEERQTSTKQLLQQQFQAEPDYLQMNESIKKQKQHFNQQSMLSCTYEPFDELNYTQMEKTQNTSQA